MPDTIRHAHEIRAVVAGALERAGATGHDAAVQAEMLTEAELRGHPSHGLRRLPVLVERLRRGLIVSGVEPRLQWRGAAVLSVDGRGGLGPAVAGRALEAIAARAADTGVAAAVIRGAHHLGMTAPYLERLAEQGCVGIVLTTSEALVHPWGGTAALIGTNPVGIGVPSARGALVLDMSTGATSAGRIRDHAARGRPLPEGWAVDGDGLPTTDAAVALDGAISPFGGAKGYALGVALEALVGVLTDTAFGTKVRGTLDIEYPVTKGDVLIAFSLRRLGISSVDRLEEYLGVVRRSGADGRAVQVPGDRARRARESALRDGIAIEDALWDEAERLAAVAA